MSTGSAPAAIAPEAGPLAAAAIGAAPRPARRRRTDPYTAAKRSYERRLEGSFDAATPNPTDANHWQQADYLSATAAAAPEVRQVLRCRTRYEVANNSYARGIVETWANDLIGTGPRLQMLTTNPELNAELSTAWATWSRAVRLGKTLRTCVKSRCQDGESFVIFTTSARLRTPAKLWPRGIEADQCTTPTLMWPTPTECDGIEFDEQGAPVAYWFLDQHPGEPWAGAYPRAKRYPAAAVCHWFREDRPGQRRGLPDLMPSLPLFGHLRRYTLAVIMAAETAANLPLVIQTSNPPADDDDDAEAPSTYDEIDLPRGTATVLPEGYQLSGLKSEQPTTTHKDFTMATVSAAGRCINMPANVAACDSSNYNYASGRLDHQTYDRSNDVERDDCEIVIVEPTFEAWVREYMAATRGLRPSAVNPADFPHAWFWDEREHVDPTKEAQADDVSIRNGTADLPSIFAAMGRDGKKSLEAQADFLGITVAELQADLRAALYSRAVIQAQQGTEPEPEEPARGKK